MANKSNFENLNKVNSQIGNQSELNLTKNNTCLLYKYLDRTHSDIEQISNQVKANKNFSNKISLTDHAKNYLYSCKIKDFNCEKSLNINSTNNISKASTNNSLIIKDKNDLLRPNQTDDLNNIYVNANSCLYSSKFNSMNGISTLNINFRDKNTCLPNDNNMDNKNSCSINNINSNVINSKKDTNNTNKDHVLKLSPKSHNFTDYKINTSNKDLLDNNYETINGVNIIANTDYILKDSKSYKTYNSRNNKSESSKAIWTKEEDNLLLHLKNVEKIKSWAEIVRYFTNKTYKQCSYRYKKLYIESSFNETNNNNSNLSRSKSKTKLNSINNTNPNISTPSNTKKNNNYNLNIIDKSNYSNSNITIKWSVEEDIKLFNLIENYGEKFYLIKNYFPKKTEKEVINRYSVKLNNSLSSSFSSDEDYMLIKYFNNFSENKIENLININSFIKCILINKGAIATKQRIYNLIINAISSCSYYSSFNNIKKYNNSDINRILFNMFSFENLNLIYSNYEKFNKNSNKNYLNSIENFNISKNCNENELTEFSIVPSHYLASNTSTEDKNSVAYTKSINIIDNSNVLTLYNKKFYNNYSQNLSKSDYKISDNKLLGNKNCSKAKNEMNDLSKIKNDYSNFNNLDNKNKNNIILNSENINNTLKDITVHNNKYIEKSIRKDSYCSNKSGKSMSVNSFYKNTAVSKKSINNLLNSNENKYFSHLNLPLNEDNHNDDIFCDTKVNFNNKIYNDCNIYNNFSNYNDNINCTNINSNYSPN